MKTSRKFHKYLNQKLGETTLRNNYRRITDNIVHKNQEVIMTIDQERGDNFFEDLKDWGHRSKKRIIQNLPSLLERLEKRCRENDIQVHYANDAEEANHRVLSIAERRGAKLFIKGKSMITEEIHLNHFLIERGYEVIESDLGEYILQLDNDIPSHLVAPAIHKVASDFSRVIKAKHPEYYLGEGDEEITASVRNILREKYLRADIGITGVNFAVAATGSLVLVENEGNGRLTTSIPPVHIAIMSMEKVVEDFSQIPYFLQLLSVSATGQIITNYVNIINGPRLSKEADGPEEVHLIILDNGRSDIEG